MQTESAIIQTIQSDQNGDLAARFACSASMIPSPGRYTLASHQNQRGLVLDHPLFQVSIPNALDDSQMPALGPIPESWNPGDEVRLRRPTGRGFQIPGTIRRLVLAALGDTPVRLLPLVSPAIQNGASIAFLTTDPGRATSLPPAVEIHPLLSLKDILAWANFLALDIPLENLPNLRTLLGLGPHNSVPCPAQALIWTPMPCGGAAECGVCAVPTRQGSFQLSCKDGPVFDLNHILW